VFANRAALFGLLAAVVISTALGPAVDWLQRRGVPRAAGVLLLYAGVLAMFLVAALLLAPLLANQGTAIAGALTDAYASLLEALRASPSRLVQRLSLQLPGSFRLTPPDGTEADPLASVGAALALVGRVGDGLFVFVSVLLLAFYWTLERERLVRGLLRLLPAGRREAVRVLLAESEARVGGYIRGLALLCLLVGAVAFVAYRLIGLPHALVLALAAGLFEAVPVVGPVLGALPALVVALSLGPAATGWVVAATVLIQVVENVVLVPRVMRRAVGVNPVVTLLSLVGFGQLFGMPGAMLAIPIAAVVQLLLDRLVLHGREPMALDGRDRLSVLRAEAQELAQDARNQLRGKPADLIDDGETFEDTLEALATDLDALLAQATLEPGASATQLLRQSSQGGQV
jgi:predicted PurR-regulated permease PerM